MYTSDYQTFVATYQMLDTSYSENKSEKVLSYISDADPDVWEGHVSGDPAVFSEFSSAFNKRFPSGKAEPEEAADFVREYLAEQNGVYTWVEGDLVEAFDSVATPELWEQELAKAEE